MIIRYKKNRSIARINIETLSSGSPEPMQLPRGPYSSCAECPYPAHGFKCFTAEGDCILTRMHGKQQALSKQKEGR